MFTETRPDYNNTNFKITEETIILNDEIITSTIKLLQNKRAVGPGGNPARLIKYGSQTF